MSFDAAQTVRDQTDRLVELGYPALAGLDEAAFRDVVAPLEKVAVDLRLEGDAAPGSTPLVLVVTRDLVRPEETVPLLRLAGGRSRAGSTATTARATWRGYHPLPSSACRDATAYLLLGVERGEEFCGVRPEDALPVIPGAAAPRSPSTRGSRWSRTRRELLEKNKCFMLSGSRRHDRRVPAMWISERAPKLGWCWDGNPHTWLGVASAAGRLAA